MRSKTSRPIQIAATNSLPDALVSSATAIAAGRIQAVGCEKPVSSKSNRCERAPLAQAVDTTPVRRLVPNTEALGSPPCSRVISIIVCPAGSTVAAKPTPMQSRIWRFVLVTASKEMSLNSILFAKSDSIFVALIYNLLCEVLREASLTD